MSRASTKKIGSHSDTSIKVLISFQTVRCARDSCFTCNENIQNCYEIFTTKLRNSQKYGLEREQLLHMKIFKNSKKVWISLYSTIFKENITAATAHKKILIKIGIWEARKQLRKTNKHEITPRKFCSFLLNGSLADFFYCQQINLSNIPDGCYCCLAPK